MVFHIVLQVNLISYTFLLFCIGCVILSYIISNPPLEPDKQIIYDFYLKHFYIYKKK